MRTRRRPLLAATLSTALLLAACATDAADAPADTAGYAGEADVAPAEAAPAAPEPGSVTEATLQALRDLDPEVAAGAHDHSDDDHAHHRDVSHPNGIDPERVVIPAIGVDADVIELGLEDNGEMEVPEDFAQTGWFKHGPKPGRVGPAVIAGHVDSRSGPAVFFRLAELDDGDQIEVHGADGDLVVFEVRRIEQHAKDDFPTEEVYAGTPGSELRLITCSGEFDTDERSYSDNTIVYAERVDLDEA